jgi:hypothetical protein
MLRHFTRFCPFTDGSWPQASISHDHIGSKLLADEARAAICYCLTAVGTALAVVAVVNAS